MESASSAAPGGDRASGRLGGLARRAREELRNALRGPAGLAFGIGLLLPITAVALHVTDSVLIDGELLSFNGEWTIPTYLTAAGFASGGAAALLASRRRPSERRAWLVVAALSLLFAAEELALGLHERAEELLAQKPLLVLEAALGVVLILLLRDLLRRLQRGAVVLLLAAAATLVLAEASALVANLIKDVEVLAKSRNALVVVEEGGEALVGIWVLAAAAPFALAAGSSRKPGP